jgi:hypothetical protein
VIRGRDYEVVEAHGTYAGKTYSEWISDWYNWFLSKDPDEHNNGPVFFLKSYPSPRILKTKVEGNESSDGSYKSTFLNYPNLVVGNDSPEIFDDQAILAPVMGANMDADDPSITEEYMRNWVRNQIDNGDNPPKSYQLTINDQPVFDDVDELLKYRVETPLFQLMVPEAEFGSSLKDFMEIPYKPGAYNSIADGYFVLLKGLAVKEYTIHSYSQGSNYGGKQRYFSEYLYHIKVVSRNGRTSSPSLGIVPERFTNILREELRVKRSDKEIGKSEYEKFLNAIKRTRARQEKVVERQTHYRKLMGNDFPKILAEEAAKQAEEAAKQAEEAAKQAEEESQS